MIFSTLLYMSLVSQCETRFTCAEGAPLGQLYMGAYGTLTNILQRSRELAIQSANATISMTERGYLDDENQAWMAEFDRIVEQTTFWDSFGAVYFPLLDPMKFTLAYPSNFSSGHFVRKFEIPSMSSNVLGRVAKQEFFIHDPRLNPSQPLVSVEINQTLISTPSSEDDYVSSHEGWRSSVAWARRINAIRNFTDVKAEVNDTILSLPVNLREFPASMKGLNLNSVSFMDLSVNSLEKLVDFINDSSSASGVKARLTIAGEMGVELYAEDGRNIAIDLQGSEKLARLFANRFDANKVTVKVGSLTLSAARPIQVVDVSAILGSSEKVFEIPLAVGGYHTISIATVEGAADALSTIDAALHQLMGRGVLMGQLSLACPAP